jgi:hypothetical protein
MQHKYIKVLFQHIPREDNFWADMLCRAAFLKLGDGIVTLEGISVNDRDIELNQDLVAYRQHEDDSGASNCAVCDKATEEL